MVFAIIGALAGLTAFVVIVVFGVMALAAKGDADGLQNRIAAGDASGLAPWSPELLAWLSRDAVGSSWYYRPMGGSRTSTLVATLPSWQGPADLIALSARTTPRKAEGRIDLLAGGVRVALVLHAGRWHVTVDGRALGAVDPASGRLDDARGVAVGWYRERSAGVQVGFRGTDLAWIERGATLHASRPATPRPLLRVPRPVVDPEAAMWLLAVVGLHLSVALMVVAAAPMARMP